MRNALAPNTRIFFPELKYIKGENNVVSNALSRLEMSENQ